MVGLDGYEVAIDYHDLADCVTSSAEERTRR
jgi:hypothetical protein